MKKQIYGKKLKRDVSERNSLFKNLISSLILNGSIKTTEPKAKAIRADVDKMVTKAKKGGVKAKFLLQGTLAPIAAVKLIDEIAPGFSKRNGGYTRIVRMGRRFNDNAQTVLMEWVELETVSAPAKRPIKKTDKKSSTSPKKSVAKPARKPIKARTSGGARK